MASEPHITDMYWSFHVTNPAHGGKETCRKCGKFILGDKNGLCNEDFFVTIDVDTGERSYFCEKHYERQTPGP